MDIEDIHCILGDPSIEDYYGTHAEAKLLVHNVQSFLSQSKTAQKLFSIGRLVQISVPHHRNQFGVILNKARDRQINLDEMSDRVSTISCYNIVVPAKTRSVDPSGLHPFETMEVPASCILRVFKEKLTLDAASVGNEASMSKIVEELRALFIKHQESPLPCLGPKDFKVSDVDFIVQHQKKESLIDLLEANKCHACPKLDEHYDATDKTQRLVNMIEHLKFTISEDNLYLLPEFECRMDVLRKLDYIDDGNAIQLKGRVARELNTVQDEMIATEMVFRSVLSDLDPAELASVISALVFQEKSQTDPTLTPVLQETWVVMKDLAEEIGSVQAKCGLDVASKQYARDNLNCGLMEVVYEWARGVPFADICLLTDIKEGSIVRCIVRIEEACREFKTVARIVGNVVLQNKLEEASQMIKRDIVFASSLYTQ